jgi:hypothetical protein
MWEIEPNNREEYDRYDYFLIWGGGEDENGRRMEILINPLVPFVPHSPVDFDDSGYTSRDDSNVEA